MSAAGIVRRNYGRNHGYLIGGKKALGVTTAMSDGMPKPALVGWAARCAAEEAVELLAGGLDSCGMNPQQVVWHLRNAHVRRRDSAAVRGTKIHHFAQLLVESREQEVEVPEELAPFVENAVKFLAQWQVRPLLSERVIGSYRWGDAGTFDLIGELPDGRRVLFDYKTGASGIWPDTALQLAAYRYADAYVAADGTEIPMKEVGISDCMGVWLRADGYDVIPLKADESVFKVFLHVLQVARARQVMDEWRGDALPVPRPR